MHAMLHVCAVLCGGGGGTRGREPGSNGNGESTGGRISKGGEQGEHFFAGRKFFRSEIVSSTKCQVKIHHGQPKGSLYFRVTTVDNLVSFLG